jgi:hypothetical protein
MECPECHTSNPSGQKFCGACGQKLEVACAQCQATNPPGYKFCGQCGASLASAGAMTLARSGLITHVTQKVLDLLGYQRKEMQGKSFSLFIQREDLVIFFSHLNDLLSSFENQSFEISLKHKRNESVYVLLECKTGKRSKSVVKDIHISLTEAEDKRQASARMQRQQDLLGLMETITDSISTVSKKHLNHSIEDALKKICLFTQAEHGCIYAINRSSKRLDILNRWISESSAAKAENSKPEHVPLKMIKRTIVRLRKEKTLVVHHVKKLPPLERQELLTWHHADDGAVACHLIYSSKQPVAVIGIVKDRAEGDWEADCIALLKFFGQLVADRLPVPTGQPKTAPRGPAFDTRQGSALRPPATEPENVIDISKKRPQPQQRPGALPASADGQRKMAASSALPDMTRPMLLEALKGRKVTEEQPVFARDDGLVLLTCPRCGSQESVSVGRFDTLGNAICVQCPCRKEFTAVLEKRRSFRKAVRLDGFFTLSGDLGQGGVGGSIWGPMVVKDLSKAGLRFTSKKAALVKPGDLLMVRFNLDNSNAALIHKPARVVSATSEAVGCRFEGSDKYDITLGFYFI